MHTLREMTDAELIAQIDPPNVVYHKSNVGVHTAGQLISRGLYVRCPLDEATAIVRRGGDRKPYGIRRPA